MGKGASGWKPEPGNLCVTAVSLKSCMVADRCVVPFIFLRLALKKSPLLGWVILSSVCISFVVSHQRYYKSLSVCVTLGEPTLVFSESSSGPTVPSTIKAWIWKAARTLQLIMSATKHILATERMKPAPDGFNPPSEDEKMVTNTCFSHCWQNVLEDFPLFPSVWLTCTVTLMQWVKDWTTKHDVFLRHIRSFFQITKKGQEVLLVAWLSSIWRHLEETGWKRDSQSGAGYCTSATGWYRGRCLINFDDT